MSFHRFPGNMTATLYCGKLFQYGRNIIRAMVCSEYTEIDILRITNRQHIFVAMEVFSILPKSVWPLMLLGAEIISKFMGWKVFLEHFLPRKVNDWLKSHEWEMRHAYFRRAQISNCVSLHQPLEVVDGLFNSCFSAHILLFLVLS